MDKITKVCTVLITGYKRSGKDYLCDYLTGKDTPNRRPWYVFSNDCSCNFRGHGILVPNTTNKRFAFADALKEEVSEMYNIDPTNDKTKDLPIEGSTVTPRDLYISHAAKMRSVNQDYWVDKTIEKIRGSSKFNYETPIITDFRYPNEYHKIGSLGNEVVTIRVFNSKVEVPSLDIASEHQLDNWATDYILTDTDNLASALRHFPQYQCYSYVCKI